MNGLFKKLPSGNGASLGITGRLAIAFFAVVVLAVAANTFIEHGTLIVRTTEIQPVAQPMPVAPAENAPAVAPIVVPHGELGNAIERFAASTLTRVANNNAESTRQMRVAANALADMSAEYSVAAEALSDPLYLQALMKRLEAQSTQAAAAVRIADERRRLSERHYERFEALDARMHQSLDHALKMFGRVIARQSLVDLNRHMDEVRSHLPNFVIPGAQTEAQLKALSQSEAAFIETIKKNERGLVRSQGQPWVDQTRNDMQALISLRAALVAADERQRAELARFAKTNTALTGMVRAWLERKPARVAEVSVVQAPVAQSTATVTAPVRSFTTASQVQDDAKSRLTIAIISGAVLLVLLIVAVGAVRSIVIPIRRLLSATLKLANGAVETRVPRGGIRELDTLAVAFNRMAEQLATAQQSTRGYQKQLESEVEQRTRELQELAENDPLTQLPNRRQLFVLLNAAIVDAMHDERHVGVFFLDLDNFKNINDGMGHAYGDQVLQEVAKRLSETAKSYGFAARLGGDEFTVVYTDAPNSEAIHRAGLELVQAFQKPLIIGSREVMMGVSVGASIYPEHELNSAALLTAADVALFHAKALGRNRLEVFAPALLEAASKRFAIEQGLRRALQCNEFELVFQPEIGVESLETALVEALLRWRQPDGTYVSPGEFLPIAEESGLIMDISDWVLKSAIQAAAGWYHGCWPEVRVAINISSRQLFDSRFVERVRDLLQQFNLPARCIEIELTENVLQTGPATIQTLQELRALGLAIALDDFGTGYSSLASLEQLPLTRVKLDRSLIASIDSSSRSEAIANAIVTLCRNLGLEVTAEGIERSEQLALLLPHRDMYLQGYLMSKPVRATELPEVLKRMSAHMQSIVLSSPGESPKSVPQPVAEFTTSERRSA